MEIIYSINVRNMADFHLISRRIGYMYSSDFLRHREYMYLDAVTE